MKKHYLISSLFLLLAITSKAALWTVEVSDFQFSPSNIPNVVVGDTIRYHFVGGGQGHNAIIFGIVNPLPPGADTINSGSPSDIDRIYDYQVNVAGDYKYRCGPHSNGPLFTGMVGTFTASAVLPATLKYFDLVTTKNKPFFTWSTLTEINVSHFSLRRSVDGFEYKEIGKVSATGNSTSEQSYSFTDNAVPEKYKYIYYLLAVVDKDGRESFSKVKVFKNPLTISKLITKLGPNPITRPGQLMIQFNSEKEGKLEAKVYDSNGKLALKLNMAAFPGLNNAHLHVCDLNAGIYTITFSIDGLKETKKVVVY